MPTSDDGELARLYDGVARFQWLRRRLAGAKPGESLQMHKRLLAPPEGFDGPAAGLDALDSWLWTRLDAPDAPRVLDVGCGFGATLFRWARLAPTGRFVGLSLSPYQVARATRCAAALGLADRCRFRHQSYDDAIDGTFDVIVSIESLFHSADLRATLANLAASLAPSGRLTLVEDMAVDEGLEHEPAAAELLARWSTTRLHTVADYGQAARASGLEPVAEFDLSRQVERADRRALARRRARLGRLRGLVPLPMARRVLDAFLGGLSLEALYGEDRMQYRVLIAERRAA